jgi:hypothetical protein
VSAVASVVIPAHNEEGTISSTLRSLFSELRGRELEVVVVCNGCSDATATEAGSITGVDVVVLPEPSKIVALRAGDEHARVFPRIYLDADVELSGAAVLALCEALKSDAPRVAGVRARFDLSHSSRPVVWFYTFRQQLPAFDRGIIGAGVYAMNMAGRARWGEWPEVIGDDQFVLRQFSEHERRVVEGHHTVVRAPEDLSTLVRRGVRIRRGNGQLNERPFAARSGPPPTGVAQTLLWAARRPSRWVPALTWVGVSGWVRLAARFGRARGDWTVSARDATNPGVR